MTPEAKELLEAMVWATNGHIGPEDKIAAALRVLVAKTRGARAKDAYELILEITEPES